MAGKASGLSIIEVLVVVAIISIIAAMGIPSLQYFVHRTRISTTADEFVSTLSFARSEAIKRGHRVTVCKSADGEDCTENGDWEQGWIVFLDPANPDDFEDSGLILRYHGALAKGMTMTGDNDSGNKTNVSDYVSYVAGGATQLSQDGTIRLCGWNRGVNFDVAVSGRVRMERVSCP
ncbi:GspH/FimT family pseudopilin [Desulfonatronum sp. SC1]|uniref:GspH/FimT family pseudopilin n=1 Tax=Desulfonatronum sp. SC1 TaxID=2109626 RepID=UPI00130484D8|nr:GspH/FimT family pseudopilin [Desulfonatronum sp. SC1]